MSQGRHGHPVDSHLLDSHMLTDTKLRALKARLKPYRLADTNGLCIEVRPNGSRVWRYRYRHQGKASIVTMTEYPMMSLAEARIERDRLRALVKGGANPAGVARAEKAQQLVTGEITYGFIAKELIGKKAQEGLGAGSVKRELRLVEKDLAGISDLAITEVSAPVLLSALRKIEKRGVIETAHRARSLSAQVFRYAIATGRASVNPADSLVGALQKVQVQHLASLTEPAEMAKLLKAIHGYTGSVTTVAALKLAPMTFVRPGELRKARWDDIELTRGEWRFTASKTDTAHIVPLSRQAIQVLTELKSQTRRSELVFPGVRSITKPMSENTVNAALRYLGFDGDTMTGHGFRAMARTVLDEVLCFRPDFIEHQLAHAVRDPLGRAYNRTAHLQERKKMMQCWSDYLDWLRCASPGTDLSEPPANLKFKGAGR